MKLLGLSLLAGVLVAAPSAASAQGGPPVPPEAAEAMRSMQQWYAELQQIGQRLSAVQQQVMQDSALRARQMEIAQDLRAAMLRADPELNQLETRARALEGEARQAQQAGNEAALDRLTQEAQQIQQRVLAAQAQAVQNNGLAARIDALETEVRARMAQIEPESPRLIERAEALQARIQETMRRQSGGAGER
jgi:small-conductance mechanosensitive channel